MSERMRFKDLKWAARLSGVREVTVVGTAELGYWRERLRGEGLEPIEKEGRAVVQIIGAEGRFLGLVFREVSFSVQVKSRHPELGSAGAYLLRAYNSRRFFAWCERTLFSTPYDFGTCEVVAGEGRPHVRVESAGAELFVAEFGAGGDRVVLRKGVEGFCGPVYLPRNSAADEGRLFVAEVRGETTVSEFDSARDRVEVRVPSRGHALEPLVESGFAATEWQVRMRRSIRSRRRCGGEGGYATAGRSD